MVSPNRQEDPPVSNDAVRRQLEKLLASAEFTRSARMSRFLRFVVEYRLGGRGDDLKEYVLGTEVFDRAPAYDPRIDPIVRVEARRLRAKLRRYYEARGGADEIVIEIPTGSYVPVFRSSTPGAVPPPAPGRSGIAVLPFANLSAEPDHQYFSDGLTEELIHRLTKIEGIRVVAWNSSAQLREQDVRAAGERLNVGFVLSGSVRRSGERLRITAQLVETATGAYTWSEAYDREMRDLFAIQEEIAWAIIGALEIRLAGAMASPRQPRNLEAYNLYLKGRFFWNKRTVEGMRKSIGCYEEAIALDPELAVCYSGLADSYTVLAEYGIVAPDDAIDKARAAAERAIALDPLLGEAQVSLGLLRSSRDWDWIDAGRYYRRGIELSPGYATARHWHAVDYLAMLGRHAEARAELETAIKLDPLSAIILEGRGYLQVLVREYEEGVKSYRELLDLDGGFYKALASWGRACIQMGQYEQAVALLQKSRTLGGDVPNVLGALGQALALAGNRDGAREILAQLASLAGRSFVPASCFAIVHLGLGETAEALQWLERGLARRDMSMIGVKVHPVYDVLRPDPRFQAIVASVFRLSR